MKLAASIRRLSLWWIAVPTILLGIAFWIGMALGGFDLTDGKNPDLKPPFFQLHIMTLFVAPLVAIFFATAGARAMKETPIWYLSIFLIGFSPAIYSIIRIVT